jgi:hypothetical protein
MTEVFLAETKLIRGFTPTLPSGGCPRPSPRQVGKTLASRTIAPARHFTDRFLELALETLFVKPDPSTPDDYEKADAQGDPEPPRTHISFPFDQIRLVYRAKTMEIASIIGSIA